MRKSRMIYGIFALSLASTSCLRQKTQPRAFTPPPARTWPVAKEGVPELPEAPQIGGDTASIGAPQLPSMTPENMPEVPEAPKRVARRPAAPVTPPKPAVTGNAPQETPAAPRLAQLLTPEEQRENTRTLDDSLERVNRTLAIVEVKNLTADQKETVLRIRTFRKQAEQARREQDLLTAVSLARRADLLAKDLLERLP
jgi:hypothetical protein